jgi:RNA polymerase sigma-70 factor (sigma-E family)
VDEMLIDFVRARYPQLLRRAYLLTGDRDLAEDLVQEALARVCAASKRRRIENLDAYARTTMVHLCIRRWRRRGRLREVPTVAPPDAGLADSSDQVAERCRMRQALREIAPRQRAVLVLRYYEDLSERQIAETLGVGVGTVRSQTARGLTRMRDALGAGNEVGNST